MSKPYKNWEELRKHIKDCPYQNCPRYSKKTPILFNRTEDSLSKTKFVVVSQEPGVTLRKNYSDSDKIEEFLIHECASNQSPREGGVPYKIRQIFGKEFNPKTDKIYWTHALKCVPNKSDKDITNEWEVLAPLCVNHFKNELNLIPSKNLVIITMGNYALALCRHILDDVPLSLAKGIMKYITFTNVEKSFSFRNKEIFLFPFIHPAYREKVLRQYNKINEVGNREEEFIERIQQFKQ